MRNTVINRALFALLGICILASLGAATLINLATQVKGILAVANGGTGVTSAQGNGSKVQLSTGSPTSGDCGQFDVNGNIVDSGANCGSGSGSSLPWKNICHITSGDTLSANGTFTTTCTIPANTLSVGSFLEIIPFGTEHVTGGTNFQYGVIVNSTQFVAQTGHSSAVGDFWWAEHIPIIVLAIGASGEIATTTNELIEPNGGTTTNSLQNTLVVDTTSNIVLKVDVINFAAGATTTLSGWNVNQLN